MEKIIGITDTRTRIKELIDRVSEKNDVFIVTRDSKPEAVVMAYEEYIRTKQELDEAKKIRFEKTLEDLKTKFKNWLIARGYNPDQMTEEEVYEIIRKA
jgi:prevent-host-death family protein